MLSTVEKLVETIEYKDVTFDVIERPEVLWVGCIDCAANNTDESDIGATYRRYRDDLGAVPKNELIAPDFSAALSINYNYNELPCALMFAKETYTDEQDERYEMFTQPGGLWLRVHVTDATDTALLGRKNHGLFEYFGILGTAAKENGYERNLDIRIEIEYGNIDGHTSYNYAYVPILKLR